MREPWIDEMMYQDELEKTRQALPVCSDCGEPLDEEFCYETFDGDLMCESCFDEYLEELKRDQKRDVELWIRNNRYE